MAMMRPTVRPWYGRRRRDFVLPEPEEEIENSVVVNGEIVVVNGETVVHTE